MTPITTWKCDVCGYVHSGSTPPDQCPTCGVDRSQFSPFVVPGAKATEAVGQWICTICDYVHTGDEPPLKCPICSASKDMFKAVVSHGGSQADVSVQGDLIIIGAGIAALTAAEHARAASSQLRIQLISKEAPLPYYRLNLTRVLAGEIDETALPLKPASWYEENRISVVNDEIISIAREQKTVTSRQGKTYPYDTLILANGAHAFVPPISGVNKKGVFSFRTLADLKKITDCSVQGRTAVIIGGGLLGLETAFALKKRGLKPHVLEGFQWLLPRQLPLEAGVLVQQHLADQGIMVTCGASVKALLGDESVAAVQLETNEEIAADLVIISAGIRPNSYLARQCDLKVAQGVVVDDSLRTSDAHIYAAGDVAQHRGTLYGIWPTAYAQGAVAGQNAAGQQLEFSPMPRSTRLKVADLSVFSVGNIQTEDASWIKQTYRIGQSYHCLVTHDGRLQGAVLVGDTTLAAQLQAAVETGDPISNWPRLTAFYNNLR